MKAAAVAAERGHDVTLYETTARLGGQILLAQQLPGRAEFGGVVTGWASASPRSWHATAVRFASRLTAPTPGESIQQYVRTNWIGTLDKLGVEIIPHSRLYGVDADTVYLQHTANGEAVLCEGVDTPYAALGQEPDMTLENVLRDFDGEIHVIGDCLGARTVEEAVLEGLKAGTAV